MSLRDKMFSFNGRLRRRDYWLITIGLGFVLFLLGELVMGILFGPDYSVFTGGMEASDRRQVFGWPFAIDTMINLAVLWVALAMSAKRAHDRNRGARPIVVLSVLCWLPLALPMFSPLDPNVATSGYAAVATGLFLVSIGLGLYLFIVVGCLDGTQGPNRFGPSPKGIGETEAV